MLSLKNAINQIHLLNKYKYIAKQSIGWLIFSSFNGHQSQTGGVFPTLEGKKCSNGQMREHILLLKNAGFIIKDSFYSPEGGALYYRDRLSWGGREFIAHIRESEIWKKGLNQSLNVLALKLSLVFQRGWLRLGQERRLSAT